MHCEKDLKDNKDNSLHLGWKYAQIFVLGDFSFPRASLSENCSLLGTDNVRGQISEHIFAPNGDNCLFISRALVACIEKENHATLFPWSTRLATWIMGNIAQHGGHTKANTKVMQPLFIAHIFDIWHPCYGQLILVEKEYLLTSIMWPYHRITFRAHVFF